MNTCDSNFQCENGTKPMRHILLDFTRDSKQYINIEARWIGTQFANSVWALIQYTDAILPVSEILLWGYDGRKIVSSPQCYFLYP